MKPTYFLLVPLLLWTTALAGGSGPPTQINPGFVLRGLSGVTVTEAPTGEFEVDSARWMMGATYTYAVQIRVGTERVRVLLTPSATENSATINTITAHVDTPTGSASQRQALVAVSRGFVEGCAPEFAPQAQSIWAGLARHNWAGALGWQDRLLGGVRVGWSGRKGLNVGKRDVTGISVNWPSGSGHCTF